VNAVAASYRVTRRHQANCNFVDGWPLNTQVIHLRIQVGNLLRKSVALSVTTAVSVESTDIFSLLPKDGPGDLIGHDARSMLVPMRTVASARTTPLAIVGPQHSESRTGLTVDGTAPPKFSKRKWPFYAFAIGYALFAVTTASASILILAAAIRPH
jgi:hypothetical protein